MLVQETLKLTYLHQTELDRPYRYNCKTEETKLLDVSTLLIAVVYIESTSILLANPSQKALIKLKLYHVSDVNGDVIGQHLN